jgi:hypothetical protein
MTSQDGISWSLELPPLAATNSVFLGVGGNSNLLMAVGSQGTVVLAPRTSLDLQVTNELGVVSTNRVESLGVFWHHVPPPTTNDLQGVAQWGIDWYICGDRGTILASQDATNWVPRSSQTAAFLSSITATPQGLLAVGKQGALVASPDGITWSARDSKTSKWLYRVRSFENVVVVVGEQGTLLTSPDGLEWTPRVTGTSRWLTDVCRVGDTFYVSGHQGTILASTNLVDWQHLGCSTEKSLFGLAASEGRLITVGVEGAILRCQVIPDPTPVRFADFTRQDTANLFTMQGKPDQRFTIDATASLTNWITGPTFEFQDPSGLMLILQPTGTNSPASEFYRATLVP